MTKMTKQPVDLGHAFTLPPAEAVAYFKAKGYQVTWNWWEMADEAHATAFTVAKATKMDVLQTIRQEVQNIFSEGITESEFKKRLTPRLQALGWWGFKPDPHHAGEWIQEGSAWRLKTIYRTNAATGYAAGRYKQQMDNVRNQPYWQYVAVMDNRTRDSHAAMHGAVYRADDPIWHSHYPPNDWLCRCRVRALDEMDLEHKGLAVQDSAGRLQDVELEAGVDKVSGEVIFKSGVRYTNPLGQTITPAAGFNTNPGQGVNWSEIHIAPKARALLGDKADALLQSLATNPIKLKAYQHFVDDVFASGQQRGRNAVVGYLQQADIDYLQAKGQQVATGAIVLEDRVMVGKKAQRHQVAGDALTIDEWRLLPIHIANPEQVLYDKKNGTLLYVFSAGDSKAKIAVQAARKGRKLGEHESIRSAFKVAADDLLGGIKGGSYEIVR